jgi:hypothetical protein
VKKDQHLRLGGTPRANVSRQECLPLPSFLSLPFACINKSSTPPNFGDLAGEIQPLTKIAKVRLSSFQFMLGMIPGRGPRWIALMQVPISLLQAQQMYIAEKFDTVEQELL